MNIYTRIDYLQRILAARMFLDNQDSLAILRENQHHLLEMQIYYIKDDIGAIKNYIDEHKITIEKLQQCVSLDDKIVIQKQWIEIIKSLNTSSTKCTIL